MKCFHDSWVTDTSEASLPIVSVFEYHPPAHTTRRGSGSPVHDMSPHSLAIIECLICGHLDPAGLARSFLL